MRQARGLLHIKEQKDIREFQANDWIEPIYYRTKQT